MKKVIVIVLIIGATALFYVMRNNFPADGTKTPATNKNGAFRPDPSDATFIFDDGPITLSAGRNERTIVAKDALTEETDLLDKFAYGDINADGKEDTALFLVRSGAGSGTFIYLAAFVSEPVTYRGSQTTFIGDRIAPQSISISKGVVTVKYLDRRLNDAFAVEPTILTTKQFIYKNREFEER